jgi:hypothetical protein
MFKTSWNVKQMLKLNYHWRHVMSSFWISALAIYVSIWLRCRYYPSLTTGTFLFNVSVLALRPLPYLHSYWINRKIVSEGCLRWVLHINNRFCGHKTRFLALKALYHCACTSTHVPFGRWLTSTRVDVRLRTSTRVCARRRAKTIFNYYDFVLEVRR